jgi:hypothetical protein
MYILMVIMTGADLQEIEDNKKFQGKPRWGPEKL